MTGHGSKLPRKKELAIAALLDHPTVESAAAAVGVNEKTLRGWMSEPDFRDTYRQARRQLVEGAVGRIQAATGQAVDTLLAVAKGGAKDADRVRADVARPGAPAGGGSPARPGPDLRRRTARCRGQLLLCPLGRGGCRRAGPGRLAPGGR